MTPTGLIVFYSALGAMAITAVVLMVWIIWFTRRH